jgi:hypothetical protein
MKLDNEELRVRDNGNYLGTCKNDTEIFHGGVDQFSEFATVLNNESNLSKRQQ